MTEDYSPTRQTPATPRRHRLALIAAGAVLVVAIGGAVAYKMLPGNGFTVSGSLTISGSGLDWGTHTGACRGSGGYDDIGDGTNIVITDAGGKTVAVSFLSGEGKATRGRLGIKPESCTWQFSVDGVPEGSDFYGVAIGHRGSVQYPRERLNEPLRLTLD